MLCRGITIVSIYYVRQQKNEYVSILSVVKLVLKLSSLDTLIKTMLAVRLSNLERKHRCFFHYNALKKFILTPNTLNQKI